MLNNLKSEKKIFYIFLLMHFLVWGLIGSIRLVLPTDTLEGIWWGSLGSLGNPKHPPLAGWITYLVYNISLKTDLFIYLLSQLFVIGGFIFTYKLAKYFLNETQAMLSVIILEGCWIYAYITGYYGFNPDVVLLFTLPAITYWFYKCMKFNTLYDWTMLGVFTGISFLGKYQTVLLLISMAVWAFIFNRKTFYNKFFYLSVGIAFMIFLPHLLWLIKYDFIPFSYYDAKLYTISILKYIEAPVLFLFMQLVVIIGTLLIFAMYKLKTKSEFKINKVTDEKAWFLIILTTIPLIIHFLVALFTGCNIRPQWGYVFWYMIGIILFYFLPEDTDYKGFKVIVKYSYIVMLIIFLSFGTLLLVEKNYRSRYPVKQISGDFQKIWEDNFHQPLKYIGGEIELTYPINIYGDSNIINIMDLYGSNNIWINQKDVERNGALILTKYDWEVEPSVKESCPFLPKDTVIKPSIYNFKLVNALGLSRPYKLYYYLVPPNLSE